MRPLRPMDVVVETFFDLDASAMQKRMQAIIDERVIDPETNLSRRAATDIGSCFKAVGNLMREAMKQYEEMHPECRG